MKYSVFDAHCDTLCYMHDLRKNINRNNCHVDMERMERYKSYTQVFACFIDPVYKSCALERCLNLIDTFHNNLPKGAILSIESGEPITNLGVLRNLHRLGVRIIALTWNFSNHIAAGADEIDEMRGLTRFGRQVVKEMNRLGIFADVSHLNDKSFYDVAECAGLPLIATHSNSRRVCNHRRNLTDNQFRIICRTGGCVGINFYPKFLNDRNSADIDDIIRHIEHFMELGGENHIGIGADFDGVDYLPDGINGCEDTYKVFDRLLQLNYSEEQVEKISHKNFERVILCRDFLQKEKI
ncbi:MAG: dipeptidase, partial [Clostridia bacterium]|nr:dipeptidase [Clostridia bacterium]